MKPAAKIQFLAAAVMFLDIKTFLHVPLAGTQNMKPATKIHLSAAVVTFWLFSTHSCIF